MGPISARMLTVDRKKTALDFSLISLKKLRPRLVRIESVCASRLSDNTAASATAILSNYSLS